MQDIAANGRHGLEDRQPAIPTSPMTYNESVAIRNHITSLYGAAGSFIPHAGAQEKKKVILVVDTEPGTARLVNDCLIDGEESFEVVEAKSFRSTVEVAKSISPDLIISNWQLPGIDGLELVRQLRMNSSTRNIPVILSVESLTSTKDLDQLLSAGVIDYMRKPIEKLELRTRVKSVIRLTDSYQQRMRLPFPNAAGSIEPDIAVNGLELAIQKEKDHFAKEVTELRGELDARQRESRLYLELLMHSGKSKDKLLEELKQLAPYLTEEGKARFFAMVKKLQRELTDELGMNFDKKFDEENLELYRILEMECPEITRNEKKLCAYLLVNNTASDIAKMTDKTLNSINVAFARLRAKLGVPSNKDLKTFLRELNTPLKNG